MTPGARSAQLSGKKTGLSKKRRDRRNLDVIVSPETPKDTIVLNQPFVTKEDMHFKGVHVGKVISTHDDLISHSYPLLVKSGVDVTPAPTPAPTSQKSKKKEKEKVSSDDESSDEESSDESSDSV